MMINIDRSRSSAVGKLVKKVVKKVEESSKSPKASKIWKICKVIGLKEHLSNHRSYINKELELASELWQFFKLFLLGLEVLLIP